ncbi:MAG: drug resistance transporter, EmrB/QacA subfamily [Solirubrobacterales bacterium]|nr:drug resistance transporter, EmrB/QacA subfamily [Solirubrobacterales bacterium]
MSRRIPSSPPHSRDDGTPHKTWTVVLASLGVFMTALDTLVVTTSLPALRVDLHSSLSNLEWTVNAYNLAFACFILTGAALGDRFGRRRMYVIGLSLFTTASAAAAASPNIGMLVGARALQGIGAAIVFPLTLTLISEAFPVAKRGTAIGLWGGITGLGVAIGPVVGGAVVGGISWHWIFWLNVPVGIALIPLAATRLTESFGPRPHLDVVGLLLAGAGALGLTWGLVRGTAAGWGSGEVVTTLVGGAALIAAFLEWERRASNPMLPLAMFRQRTFASANAVSVFMYAGLFGALFLMSQFFQTALGYSPLGAGLRLLPWSMPPMFIAPLAGALADRYGNRPFMALGLALQAGGLAWVALIAAPGVSYAQIGVALTIAGTGTSFCFPTVANAIMGSVPLKEAGIASGANSALREFGGVLGVAVLASVFARQGVYTSPRAFVDGFTPALWVAVGFSALGFVAALLTASRPEQQRTHELASTVALEGGPA